MMKHLIAIVHWFYLSTMFPSLAPVPEIDHEPATERALIGTGAVSDAAITSTIDSIDVPPRLGTIGKLARAGAQPIDRFQEIAKVTGMTEVTARNRL
jgi:hypothetical protein